MLHYTTVVAFIFAGIPRQQFQLHSINCDKPNYKRRYEKKKKDEIPDNLHHHC